MNLLFQPRREAVARPSGRISGSTPLLCPWLEQKALSFFASILISLLFVIILPAGVVQAAPTPAGVLINNTATATYTDGPASGPRTVLSNTVSVTTVALRTPSTIEFLQYAPALPGATAVSLSPSAYSTSGTAAGSFVAQPAPLALPSGAAINLASPVPLVPAQQYHESEAVFIRLTDGDQNLDPAAAETVIVMVRDGQSGDTEWLRLTETGPDTGVFVGYVQTTRTAGASGDGVMTVPVGSLITVSYTDAFDGTDSSTTAALVDPYGIVFNSLTGQPVNGATVTLMDTITNLPATVYGDDGVSTFPAAGTATVTSGGTAIDGSGASYTFPPGGFRFPYVNPGRYRFVVTPPAGYRAPSIVSTADLQALPGGFAIVSPGSRGEEFILNPGPALHIDYPIDPINTRMYLVKTTPKNTAALGDFVPYRLTVENIDPLVPVLNVTVQDKLPLGFRYRSGSTKVNGVRSVDPSISSDGRMLIFAIGTIAAGQTTNIDYVVEVAAGARQGKATNSAVAAGDLGAYSNNASASILVTDDLLTGRATVMGRVIIDGCGDRDKAESGGLANARLYLEDGTFVVTDKDGKYHFKALKPGTHVIQVDEDSIAERYELMICEEEDNFAGSANSRFVNLQAGTLWRADFHLGLKPPREGEVGIELRTSLRKKQPNAPEAPFAERKEIIEYAIPVHVGAVPARNLRITVLLPQGATYRAGTAMLDAAPFDDPQVTEGAVTFRLKETPAEWEGTLRFDVQVQVAGPDGPLATQAILTVDTPQARNERTPRVETAIIRHAATEQKDVPDVVLHPKFESGSANLSPKDKKDLDRLLHNMKKLTVKHITVIGHTDSQRISRRLQKTFADNGVLSRARAQSVGAYLATGLHLTPEQVTYDGKGPDEPVASNKRADGRAKNRRVELKVQTVDTIIYAELLPGADRSGMKAVATMGLRPGETWPRENEDKVVVRVKDMPDYDAAWLAGAESGNQIVWPPEGFHPSIPSLKAGVKSDPALTVKLYLNREEVEPLYFDGTLKSADNRVAISTWRSLHLIEGDNLLEAVFLDAAGQERERQARTVHYSGGPVKAVLVPAKSRLSADGKHPAVIAVLLTDKDGHPTREGITGEYSVDPPYLPKKRVDALHDTPLMASTSERLLYTVGEDGMAMIELEPTPRSGEAVIRFPLGPVSQELRAWLKPESRDWILVGLADGTVGYNVVNGNRESLGAAGEEDNLYRDGRLALYAKGRIKGEWLLTMAYDTDKNGGRGKNPLYQTVDPNKYYLLYGDATDERFDAASTKSLYVKLEREQFYALFGDYQTGLSVTELSRYNRNFTGFKSEMKTDGYQYSAFASETNQAYIKDEIRGEGTSGLYRLSRSNIIMNSETITIETRDRFKSEVIVATQRLTRFLDYSLDYDSGTIWFKSPIYGHDAALNPVFIVAEYESNDASDSSFNYGGRGALKLLDNRLETGATYIHEGRVGGEGNLEGVDLSIALDEKTKIRAEAATTRTDQSGAITSGSAYLAEVQYRSAEMESKAYLREQGAGFGLGQQNGSETDTRKMGMDILYRLQQSVTLAGEFFRQDNLATGAFRNVAEVRSTYSAKQYEVLGGLRYAEDTLGNGIAQQTDQLFAGVKYRVTDRLTARVRYDQSLGSNGNADFPTRTNLGLDYRLNESATLFAEQERTWGASQDSATSRIGFSASPWTGGQLSSTLDQQSTEYGPRLFSTTGLKQSWQVNKQWSLDAGLDRAATIRHPGDTPVNVNVPQASGGGIDYTAVSLGAGYRQERWSLTGRVEERESEVDRKINMLVGANGEFRDGLGLAGGIQVFRTITAAGAVTINQDIRLGLAYRPLRSEWIVLERLDLIKSEQKNSTINDLNWRQVNNINLNYTHADYQASLQYACKYVRETIDAQDYRGYTDMTGLELRYELSPRYDIGIRGRVLHSWGANQYDYGSSLSLGMNPAKNTLVRIGYNMTGFKDADFSKAEFTSVGPFIKVSLKFDQVSARSAVKWITGQQ